jgi:outer membrane protein assembly factor BamB
VRAPGFAPLERRLVGEAVAAWAPQLTRQATSSQRLDRTVESPPTALAGGDRVVVDRSGDVSRVDDGLTRTAWTFRSGDLSGYLSRALLFGDQVVIASLDGTLRALNVATGEVVWQQTGMPCEVSPAISGGTLWVATTAGELHAIDLVKGQRVTADLGFKPSDDLVAYDGDVLVVGARGEVSRWSSKAKRRWRVDLGGLAGPRAVLSAGVLVMTDDQGLLAGVDANTGRTRWRRDLRVAPFAGISAANGQVLVTTPERVLRLQAADGEALPAFVSATSPWAGPACVVGDRIVVPTEGGLLQVLDRESGRPLYALEGDAKSRLLETSGSLYVIEPARNLRYHRTLP